MPELIADLFISVDGCAKGSRSPGYFGFGGPDLDRWIRDQMRRPQRHIMGRKTYEALAAALDLVGQSVLDGRIVLSEYRPSGAPP